MKRPHGAIDSNVQADVATVAEEHERPPGLMSGSVAGDQEIALEEILVKLQSLLKMGRAGFFLAF